MTFNWQTLADRGHRLGKESPNLAGDARRMTLPASFWSMVCASLGFGSLLIVQAKPLRELGFGGVLGSVIALLGAYGMYPAFLAWAVPRTSAVFEAGPGRRFWSRRFVPLSAAVIVASLALASGMTRLNTDPNLLDYFKPHQPLRDGLEFVDRNGGSNPLTIVVSSADGSTLNHKDAIKQLWTLQSALEAHKGVGTVVALPALMAEGRRRPLAFLLSSEHILKILDEPAHERIGRTFVTDDRTQAAFYLRMIEHGRDKRPAEGVSDHRAGVP